MFSIYTYLEYKLTKNGVEYNGEKRVTTSGIMVSTMGFCHTAWALVRLHACTKADDERECRHFFM